MEFDEALPVYVQIATVLEGWIFSGQLEPGAKMPTVRQLSAQLGANANTVQRALMELERADLVRARRTAGRFVTADESRIARARAMAIGRVCDKYLSDMAALGCGPEEIAQWLHMDAPAAWPMVLEPVGAPVASAAPPGEAPLAPVAPVAPVQEAPPERPAPVPTPGPARVPHRASDYKTFQDYVRAAQGALEPEPEW
jgi:DNA-binding transcriptional regulator YhcF (GntR family)